MSKVYPDANDIMNSLDGIQKSEAPAFFATRVLAKYDKKQSTAFGWLFFQKPMLTLAMLIILLVVNIKLLNQTQRDQTLQQEATSLSNNAPKPDLQSFAGEYNLQSQTSSY